MKDSINFIKKLSYLQRAKSTKNLAAKKLLEIMERKESNLIFAADITNMENLVAIVEQIGEYIPMLKTHVDMTINFDYDSWEEIVKISRKKKFLLFEDRKFADIGKIVALQMEGYTKIAKWANFVTAHLMPGEDILKGINVTFENNRKDGEWGTLLVAQMSSRGAMIDEGYEKFVVDIANNFQKDVAGFICSGSDHVRLKKFSDKINENFIILTPGINLYENVGSIGQKYGSPENAIYYGSDGIIVGSGVYENKNPVTIAEEYRKKAWNAYLNRTYE